MIPAAANTLFFAVFGAATIAFVILVVVTFRFTWGRMTASRNSWLDSQHGQPLDDEADGADEAEEEEEEE